ncbi:hypothetical protein SOVF_105420 [Spinacia oleracea]|nr:hypothetical protein SOVF_105420 [Spinacia oleracea]
MFTVSPLSNILTHSFFHFSLSKILGEQQFLAVVEAVLVLVAVYSASPGAAARVLRMGCTLDLVCSAGSGLCTVRPYVLLIFTFVVFVMFG